MTSPTQLILNDHRKIRSTFQKILSANTWSVRYTLFQQLALLLDWHEKMEQTCWYPYLLGEKVLGKQHYVHESISHVDQNSYNSIKTREKEERKAGVLLKALTKMASQVRTERAEEVWIQKFRQLKMAVFNHAEKEETLVFPLAVELWKPSGRALIARRMMNFKQRHEKAFFF
jgi:hypothetical protein